jgi:hypothetical protein
MTRPGSCAGTVINNRSISHQTKRTITVKALYKSTIIIWTEYDPTELELRDLAHQAESGDACCSSMTSALVAEPEKDTAWDGTEFFDLWDDDEDDEVPATGPDSPDQETKST